MTSSKRFLSEWPLAAGIAVVIILFVTAVALPQPDHHHGEQNKTERARSQQAQTQLREPPPATKSSGDPAETSGDPRKDAQQGNFIRDRLFAVVAFFDIHNGSFNAVAAIAVAAF